MRRICIIAEYSSERWATKAIVALLEASVIPATLFISSADGSSELIKAGGQSTLLSP